MSDRGKRGKGGMGNGGARIDGNRTKKKSVECRIKKSTFQISLFSNQHGWMVISMDRWYFCHNLGLVRAW